MTQASYTGTDNLEVMAEARNYNEFLVSLISRANQGRARMLDFGAGVGTFATALSQRGFEVDCVEPDAAQAASTRNAGFTTFTSIDSVPSEAYDFVYSLNVLEHIEDDLEALRQLGRVLRPGGQMLLYVPAFQLLYSSMDRKVGHVRRYRLNELSQKVESAGLRVKTIRYADSLGFLASIVFKFVGNDDGTISRRSIVVYDRLVFPLSRALDHVADRWIGKNLSVEASKPASSSGAARA